MRSRLSRPPQQREEETMTANIETAVHYRYVEPLLATGRLPDSREVAERLGVPIEEVRRALRSLADTHGVVLHTHVCEPWVIHPFSASPIATWVESGDRGWWATCMSKRPGCASHICGCISRCRRGTPGTVSTISARPSCPSAVPRTSGPGA